jgi:ribokinase
VFVDANGERTITTLGERLAPNAADDLPWSELDGVDAVYVTAGDPGAIREARRARVLVATSRIADLSPGDRVRLEAVVGSAADPAEAIDPDAFTHPTRLIVRTESVRGGRYETDDGRSGTYDAVAPPGP